MGFIIAILIQMNCQTCFLTNKRQYAEADRKAELNRTDPENVTVPLLQTNPNVNNDSWAESSDGANIATAQPSTSAEADRKPELNRTDPENVTVPLLQMNPNVNNDSWAESSDGANIATTQPSTSAEADRKPELNRTDLKNALTDSLLQTNPNVNNTSRAESSDGANIAATQPSTSSEADLEAELNRIYPVNAPLLQTNPNVNNANGPESSDDANIATAEADREAELNRRTAQEPASVDTNEKWDSKLYRFKKKLYFINTLCKLKNYILLIHYVS